MEPQTFKVERKITYKHLIETEIVGIPENLPLWARRHIENPRTWHNHKKSCVLVSGGALKDELIVNGVSYRKPGRFT
ncbi:MAG: hypothetical protein ACE5DO_15785 [Desulfobacterales bacterium]